MKKKKKKKHFENLRHTIKWKNDTIKSLKHLRDSHERLEKKLSFDKTRMISICQMIYEKLKGLGTKADMKGLKNCLLYTSPSPRD